MAQVARKHHFVPQSYLAEFTDTGTKDGVLCVFDFKAHKFFRQIPRNVAWEIDFNRVDVDGHPPDFLEFKFGEMEGQAASAIRQTCAESRLPEDDQLNYILNLMALLAVRNPAMRRSVTAARRHERRIIGDLLASDRRLYESHVRRAREGGFVSGPEVPFEQMREVFRRDDPIEINPQEHLQTELRVFREILSSLGSRSWSLLIGARDAPDFVTCDHPVSLAYRQTVFPISTRHAVLGDRENRVLRADHRLGAEGVAEVNSRILKLSDRQIFSRTPQIALLDAGEVLNVSLFDFEKFSS